MSEKINMPSAEEMKNAIDSNKIKSPDQESMESLGKWYDTHAKPGHGVKYVFSTEQPREKWTEVEDEKLTSVNPEEISELIKSGEAKFSEEAMREIIAGQKKLFNREIDEHQAILNIINSNQWYGWGGTIAFLYGHGFSPKDHIIMQDEKGKK